MLNFWLDFALFLAVLAVGWISAMTFVVLPPPTKADGWRVWGLTFDEWRDVQATALCVCAVLAIEHLVLHWNWVCSLIATRLLRRRRPDEAVQAIYGVGTFIAILLAILASIVAASLSACPSEFPVDGSGR